MAGKGVELASAYISLSVSTDDVPEQIESALNKAGKGADKAGQRIGKEMSDGIEREVKKVTGRGLSVGRGFGRSFSSGLGSVGITGWMSRISQEASQSGNRAGFLAGKAMGVGVTAGLGVAVAGIGAVMAGAGYALTKGFERLNTLDQARFKLKALGKTEEQIAKITENVTEVVKGTPFALQEAFGAAVSAVGSGVESAEELQKYLTAIGDAAAFSGTGFEDMAIIFGQVMNKGKLQAEEMLQLNERGIPIQALLQKEYRLSGAELEKMSKDGQLNIGHLIGAVDTGLSGMAKKMGETLQGSLDNMKTAAARVGATFITAISGGDTSNLTEGVDSLTNALDGLEAWVKDHVPEIVRGVESIGSAFIDTATGAMKVLSGLLRGQAGLKRLEAFTHFRQEVRDELRAGADAADALADSLDGEIEKNEERKRSWKDSQTAIANVAQVTEDLGTAVKKAQADTDGGVILKAPTAADLNAIDEAKYRVEQIPGSKDFRVIPKTEDATNELASWREKEGEKPLNIGARAGTKLAEQDVGAWRTGEEGNPVRVEVDPVTETATTELENWKKLVLGQPLQIPVQTIGSGPTGSPILDAIPPVAQGPLDVFAPGSSSAPQVGTGGSSYGVTGTVNDALDGKKIQPLIGPGAQGTQAQGLSFAQIDQIAASFGVSPGSKTRPGDPGYHGSGQATDYNGSPKALQAFAAYMSQNYGSILKELIFDAPGWAGNVKNGGITGPFGNVYTMDQAGYHGDHVHIAIDKARGYESGGGVNGAGTGTSDSIPAYLSNGEHVLTASDVAALGGQGGVYAFRNALHRNTGGAVTWMDLIKDAVPWGVDPKGGRNEGPGGRRSSAAPFGPWWDMDWLPPENPAEVGPGKGKWWHRGPTKGRTKFGFPPIGTEPGFRKPLPSDQPPPDERIKLWGGFADGGAVRIEDILMLAQQQGVDPNTMQHGQGQQMPGPTPEQLANLAPARSEGYIPAAAGNTGTTGGGIAGGFINMGAEAINGLIDMAASAASTGANAFAPGSGMAIEMGAQIAKRGVQYGAEMAGIGIGAVTEILTPFGAPRWLTDVDPTSFMPQHQVQPAAVTSGEKARQDIFAQQAGVPPGPEQLGDQHGANLGVPPGPMPPPPPGAGQPPVAPPTAPPPPPADLNDPLNLFRTLLPFDTGGVLQPNSMGVNLSNRPEYVFTQSQFKAMEANASTRADGGSGATYNVYAQDVDGAIRELRKQERRNSRQYSGRP